MDFVSLDSERYVVDCCQQAEIHREGLCLKQTHVIGLFAPTPQARVRPATPAMPPLPNRVATTTTIPTANFQCSVKTDIWSINSTKTNAPTMGPTSVPRPPRMTIIRTCAE